jgi:murein peptide amidase A
MSPWTRKLPFLSLLLAVITACVSLPDSEQPLAEATSAQTEITPVPAELALVQDVPAAPLQDLPAVTAEDESASLAGEEPALSSADMPLALASAPVPVLLQPSEATAISEQVDALCRQIGNKLGSVSVEDCLRQSFRFGGGFSFNQRPLVIKDLAPSMEEEERFRVLLLGGIHGDEYSSISIIFKWLELFSHNAQEGGFHWRIAPLANPDGLLDGSKAQRENANGVDLNRNFPSRDWNDKAAEYWQVNTGRNPRRFPGNAAASEPEVQWILDQIEEFQPDVIISVHAPYHLLDFDGPAEAPQRIGELYLHQLGVYPGSLGNFAGLDRQIPVITLELPSAGILPEPEQIRVMWRDLVTWLDSTGRKNLASRL